MNKAEALATRYNRMYGYEWLAIPEYFTEKRFNNVHGNIYISFVDTVAARRAIDTCFKYNIGQIRSIDDYHNRFILWIDAGNTANCSNVFCSMLGQNTIIDQYPNLQDDVITPSCSTIQALKNQSLFINVFTADIVANILWEAIYENKDLPNIVYFNQEFLNIKKVYENTDKQPKSRKPKQSNRIPSKSPRRRIQTAAAG